MTIPLISGLSSIDLGSTVQISTTFSPLNPPGAVCNLAYFQQGSLIQTLVTLFLISGTTWVGQWDSRGADPGVVSFSVHTTGPTPIVVNNGQFILASNNATLETF